MRSRWVAEESYTGIGTLSLADTQGATVRYNLDVYAKEQEVRGSWRPVGFKMSRVRVWDIREHDDGFLWAAFQARDPLVLILDDGHRQRLVMTKFSLMSGAAEFVPTGGLEDPIEP